MLRESLRPWRNAGLEFLLDEHGVFAQASAHAVAQNETPAAPANATQNTAAGAHGNPQASRFTRQSPAPQQVASQTPPAAQGHSQAFAARQQAERHQPHAPAAPAAGTPSGNVRPRVANGLTVHPTALPPEEWPAPWQTIWNKAKVPSAVVWTYWSLGDDLSGRANAERGALLRKIIGSLQLPAGSSAFWPVALPQTVATPDGIPASELGELTAAPEIFLAGLRRLRPRYCITFGSKALKTFAPDAGLAPYTFTQFLGHRLIALPDIDILLKNQGTVPAIIAFLKTAVTLRG